MTTGSYSDRSKHAILILLVLHVVGIIGIKWLAPSFFLKLTPLHLFVSFLCLVYAQRRRDSKFFLFIALAFIVGFGVEYLGVHYGFLFGDYHYGSNLGPKVGGIPPIIGINWAMLVIAASELVRQFGRRLHAVLGAVIAGSLLVLLDLFIEPDAIAFDYWTWDNDRIPTTNYMGWWLVASLLSLAYLILTKENKNKAAIILLILQYAFFIFV